jgi:hypothetical protein
LVSTQDLHHKSEVNMAHHEYITQERDIKAISKTWDATANATAITGPLPPALSANNGLVSAGRLLCDLEGEAEEVKEGRRAPTYWTGPKYGSTWDQPARKSYG